ncbi:1-deoxy-D-xylulose 5-phosphate reductoisomerase [Hibiscus syriacus]|uniref:1-deoxy-D-xylulose 5-phosphate reductoisomerase n=1 Tax=Hibiscus syriacus TaxID=106335 RepID=A0A6A3BYJ6_HIBSY|nr:probable methyltransferase At1g27930 [Hibiscus syriacus]KAE8721756.1 1-deoxy-D-xylulose 5-phosphate reductoisomerase [Hibiscus syriacus]
MKFPARKLLPALIFILSCFSVLRLLKLAITYSDTWSRTAALSSSLGRECSSPSECSKIRLNAANETLLTPKELMLVSNLITSKAPCNLLVFGLQSQYLDLASMNAGGITLFLEDDLYRISKIKSDSNRTRIYKVKYQVPAKKAYKLLKHARGNPACNPSINLLQQSSCKLALTDLPKQVYELKWDVVVVDGPIGDTPDAQGRMSTIYTASMLARAAGNTTNVMVHDVHRTIEKWFSWEFLCEENMVSAKGKLWNFRIAGESNSTSFCSSTWLI